ncbi:MAG: hypothetical protein ABL921_14000 [Pirellula sp.]
MKTTLAFRFRTCFAGLLLAGFSATGLQAAIMILPGTVTETFTVQPPANNWSTTTGLFGSNAANITDDATADALVGTPSAPSGTVTNILLNAQLLSVAGGTVTTANQSRYYDSGFIGTTPTGTDANLTMVTLTNATGGNLASLAIRYELASQNAATQVETSIAGHRVYWSLTGNANSWNPIGNFSTLGTVNLNVPFGTWAANTDAYVLWLDDNSTTNPDGLYTLDNVSFTAVPEPSACLLAIGALGMIGFKRLRSGRKLLVK